MPQVVEAHDSFVALREKNLKHGGTEETEANRNGKFSNRNRLTRLALTSSVVVRDRLVTGLICHSIPADGGNERDRRLTFADRTQGGDKSTQRLFSCVFADPTPGYC